MAKKKTPPAPRAASGPVKEITRIEDLKLDPKNPNRHTKRGRDLVEASLRNLGAGRGVVAARDGTVIAGNLTVEEAAAAGFKVKVVRTRGDELVVVQREDMDPDGEMARRLRVVDNQAAAVSLEWDRDVLADLQKDGLLGDLDGVPVMTPFEVDALLGTGTFEPETPAQDELVKDTTASVEQVDEMRAAKKRHAERVAERDDTEFSLVLVFPSRAAREEFLERWGQDKESKYLSGVEFSDALAQRLKKK